MPRSLAPTSASALASSISWRCSPARRATSPRATKPRSRRMISPLRSVCSTAWSSAWRTRSRSGAGACQQAQRAAQVVGDGGQRLVQLVRQRRRHLPHRRCSRETCSSPSCSSCSRRSVCCRSVRSRTKPVNRRRPVCSPRRPTVPSGTCCRPCAGRRRRGRCR